MKPKKFSVKRIGRTSGVVHEHITVVDEEDAHYLRNSYWVAQWSANDGNVYIIRNKGGKPVEFLHHVVVGADPKESVHHINGDSLDNRKSNLLRGRDRVKEIES